MWRDLFAGLTIGSMFVPQGIAYASLMGAPPIHGLYACLIPIIVYAFLSSSNRMTIGPVALTSLLVYAALSDYQHLGPEGIIGIIIAIGLIVGVVQLIMGWLKLGFVANFLSQPVLSGFVSAACLAIVISQIPSILGISKPLDGRCIPSVVHAVKSSASCNLYNLACFVICITALFLFKKIHHRVPAAFLVLVLSIIAVWTFHLDDSPLTLVREVPSGLPLPIIPEIDWQTFSDLFPSILALSLVGFVETISVAKVLEQKYKDHEVRANKELVAIGCAKIGGALFQAIPTSGSFSRSAINSSLGASTQMSSLFAMTLVLCTLLFLTPVFYYLPYPMLSAVIVLSVLKLFDAKAFIRLWKSDRRDFAILLVCFLITLLIGIEEGLLVGVLLSFSFYVYQSIQPSITTLQHVEGTQLYKDPERFETMLDPEVLILRYNGNLYFGNAYHFKRHMLRRACQPNETSQIKHLILDAGQIDFVDSTGIDTLHSMTEELHKNDVKLYISGMIGQVRDKLYRAGFLRDVSLHHPSVADAMHYIKTGQKRLLPNDRDYSMQSNEVE